MTTNFQFKSALSDHSYAGQGYDYTIGTTDLRSYETNLDLQADNPIAYAYTLLEQSGQFADATWNV